LPISLAAALDFFGSERGPVGHGSRGPVGWRAYAKNSSPSSGMSE
jgi:hypothetical protein